MGVHQGEATEKKRIIKPVRDRSPGGRSIKDLTETRKISLSGEERKGRERTERELIYIQHFLHNSLDFWSACERKKEKPAKGEERRPEKNLELAGEGKGNENLTLGGIK